MNRALGNCQALLSNGKRCRCVATTREQYHGNQELYGFGHNGDRDWPVAWVLVNLCRYHATRSRPARASGEGGK